MIRIIFSLFLLFSITFGGFAQVDKAQIDALYSDLTSDQAGAAIAIIKEGKIIYQNTFGQANIEHQVPVAANTTFLLSDVSQPFIAYAILLLEADGKLNLNDDVEKYISEMPNYKTPLRIRHLLTHTHGLPKVVTIRLLQGKTPNERLPKATCLSYLYQLPTLNNTPGMSYDYNAMGFVVAAEIIERVSGQSLAAFMKERIFEPLDMQHSFFVENHHAVVSNRSQQYSPGATGLNTIPRHSYNVEELNIYSSITDMAKWMQFLQSKASNRLQEQVKLDEGNTEQKTGYLTYGQFLEDYKGMKIIERNGLAYGNFTFHAQFPEHRFSIVALSNNYSFPSRLRAMKIVDMYLAKHLKEATNTSSSTPTFVPLSSKIMQTYTGHYLKDDRTYAREIYVRDDTLRYSRGNGNESDLGALNDHTFQMLNTGESTSIVRFEVANGKKTMRITLDNDHHYTYHYYEPSTYSAAELKAFSGQYYSPLINMSYQVKSTDKSLIFSHLGLKAIEFKPLNKDGFTSDRWYFSNIAFKRDASGKIVGFELISKDVQGVYFEKM